MRRSRRTRGSSWYGPNRRRRTSRAAASSFASSSTSARTGSICSRRAPLCEERLADRGRRLPAPEERTDASPNEGGVVDGSDRHEPRDDVVRDFVEGPDVAAFFPDAAAQHPAQVRFRRRVALEVVLRDSVQPRAVDGHALSYTSNQSSADSSEPGVTAKTSPWHTVTRAGSRSRIHCAVSLAAARSHTAARMSRLVANRP